MSTYINRCIHRFGSAASLELPHVILTCLVGIDPSFAVIRTLPRESSPVGQGADFLVSALVRLVCQVV